MQPKNSQLDKNEKNFTAIGLMSGTSMDGIDSALINTDGKSHVQAIANSSLTYETNFKTLLKNCERFVFDSNGDLSQAREKFNSQNEITFDQIIEKSTDLHIQAARKLLVDNQITANEVDVIGYHGQTLFHNAAIKRTVQIGNAQRLADSLGIPVVYDFRSNDIKHEGQGAPFAPLYHQAIAKQSGIAKCVVVNCGGISNITIINTDENDLYAYDCGPGNNLIDRFVQLKTGERMDEDGKYGEKGKVIPEILHILKDRALILQDGSNYLEKKPPKSLDANDITFLSELKTLNLADGCATLEAFTAQCIVESLDKLAVPIPKLWILAGGGWKNKVITRELEKYLKHKLGADTEIKHADQIGWNGQALEAQLFAYLAVRSVLKLPLSLPGTTGVRQPITGGQLVLPHYEQAHII